MKNLTSLPVLLSTLFLWTLSGSFGCGGNTGAGTGDPGGTAGANTGGDSGGGGSSTGGSTGGESTGGESTGGSSTGGTSTGGSGGSGGGELPLCSGHESKVFACLQSGKLPQDPVIPIQLDEVGLVKAIRPPNPGELCGPSYWYTLGWAQAPQTMIDLTQADGTVLTIGLAVPGFSQNSVAVGAALSVHFTADMVGFGGRNAVLEVKQADALVAAVGENMPAGVTPVQGASECYSEDNLCGRRDITMDVSGDDGAIVSIPNGETADVGDLKVTNDRYLENYDTSGGCNFGLAVEYLMSAAAAQ
jgi:hypothetical protein